MKDQIDLLLRSLDQAYNRKSWHGTNLRGSLRGMSADLAGRRIEPGRHSIAEITVHAAYWKYSVRRRLTGEPKGTFAYEGSDWFERPERLSAPEWKQDLALLSTEHRKLREAISTVDATRLTETPTGSKTSYLDLILGVAAHDIYHAGQIQLIKRHLSA